MLLTDVVNNDVECACVHALRRSESYAKRRLIIGEEESRVCTQTQARARSDLSRAEKEWSFSL
jgi:hypothetical protein